MLRAIILALLLATGISSTPEAVAQEYAARRAGDPLIPSCRFERALCGYVNEAGETVIAPKFDWAGRFVEGRARVKLGSLYGFIDVTGNEVIPLIYDATSDFWHGVAQVRRENQTALIDRDGGTIIAPGWDHILPLEGERYLVGRAFPYQREQPVSLRFDAGGWGQWWILDQMTGSLTALPGRRIAFLSPENRSRLLVSDNGPQVLFDIDGRKLAGPFQTAAGRDDGSIEVFHEGRRFKIDQDGNELPGTAHPANVRVTDDKWNLFFQVETANSPVRHFQRKWGYLDRDGKIMIAARFDMAYAFEGDVARVRLDGEEVLINRTGAVIGRADGCQDGLSKQRRGDRFVILGPDGQPINDETYHYVRLICDSPSIVMYGDDDAGLVRADGALIGGRYFWRASPFYDEVAGVFVREGKWGIIDEAGEFVLQPVAADVAIGSTGHGRTSIDLADGRVLLDRHVAERLARDPGLLTIPKDAPVRCRGDGVTIARTDGAISFRDSDGREFVRGSFAYATCFDGSGTAWVAVTDRQEWCKIDKAGEILHDTCQCRQPLIIFESWGRNLGSGQAEPLPCYQAGLKAICEVRARHPSHDAMRCE